MNEDECNEDGTWTCPAAPAKRRGDGRKHGLTPNGRDVGADEREYGYKSNRSDERADTHTDSRPKSGRHHRAKTVNRISGVRESEEGARAHRARGPRATLRIGNGGGKTIQRVEPRQARKPGDRDYPSDSRRPPCIATPSPFRPHPTQASSNRSQPYSATWRRCAHPSPPASDTAPSSHWLPARLGAASRTATGRRRVGEASPAGV